MFFITRSHKKTDLSKQCQQENLVLIENDHIYSLIRDGGVRCNATYFIIERAIKLCDVIDTYSYRSSKSEDLSDKNAQFDILQPKDWDMLIQFCAILKQFCGATKRLEGNVVDGTLGALWEVISLLELLLYGLHDWTQKLSYDVGSQYLLSSITLATEKL